MRTQETFICDEVGHEYRPAAGGRIACVCCGAEHLAPALVADEGEALCDGTGEITGNPSRSWPQDPQLEVSSPCPGCPGCETDGAPAPGTKGER